LPANAILFDGRTAAGQAVTASLASAGLELRAGAGELIMSLPLAGLARTDADAPGASATFRSRRGAERLEIHDPALLAQLLSAGIGRGSPGGWSARGWAGLAGGIASALVLAAVLIDQAPSLAVPLVPRALERGWSSAIEAAVANGNPRCTAPAGRAAIVRLVGRLAEAAGVSPVPAVTLLDTPLVNAFTLPDGRIVVLQGLIARAEDPDEFAGVLAHELGHARRRDPTRETLRRLELNMLARALGWGGGIAGQMTALSYGRRAEAAADASALQTLRRAHLRADGLARFFTLLHKSEGSGGEPPAFLSDHPSTASRALALQAGPEGEAAMTPAEWSAVKAMCDQRPR
jgi:Zn-dependent protease with chaperone function